LFILPTVLSAQVPDVWYCIGTRSEIGVRGGWEGSTYEFMLVQPEAGKIIETSENSIIVQWGEVRGIFQLAVRETGHFEHHDDGCPGDWAYLNVEIRGDHAEFTLPEYKYCGDEGVFIEFNKDNFLAWSWVDNAVPDNGFVTRPGRYELRTIDHNMCRMSAFVDVIQVPYPTVTLGRDFMACTDDFSIPAFNISGNQQGTIYTCCSDVNGVQTTLLSGENATTLFVNNHDQGEDTRIWVIADNRGCLASDSMMVENCHLRIPNTFTPNNDGDNDTWNIYWSIEFPDMILEVFDRWGRRVFVSPRGYPQPWDGRNMNGQLLPMETYYYVIHLNDGIRHNPLTGTITIIR